MVKTKVYLSKSNASEPTFVSNVRDRLKSWGFEVLEFLGGKYTDADNKKLLSADYLIIVPPTKQKKDEDYEVNVGRGQYEQYNSWKNAKDKSKGTAFCVERTSYIDDLVLYKVDDGPKPYISECNYSDEWALLFMETRGGQADSGYVVSYTLAAIPNTVEIIKVKVKEEKQQCTKDFEIFVKNKSIGDSLNYDIGWGNAGTTSGTITIPNDYARILDTNLTPRIQNIKPILAASLFI